MKAFFRRHLSVALYGGVLALGGCSQGPPPKVDVKYTSTDLRQLSATEIVAKIKTQKGSDFASVSLKTDGPHKYVGTVKTADGKESPITVAVTTDKIDYQVQNEDGFSTGTIKESSTSIEAGIKTSGN